jgi:hypothetical protein
MSVLKGFEELLSSERIMGSFQFKYESSNSHDLSMAAFMDSSLGVFRRV